MRHLQASSNDQWNYNGRLSASANISASVSLASNDLVVVRGGTIRRCGIDNQRNDVMLGE